MYRVSEVVIRATSLSEKESVRVNASGFLLNVPSRSLKCPLKRMFQESKDEADCSQRSLGYEESSAGSCPGLVC